jgi:hypothetical protein
MSDLEKELSDSASTVPKPLAKAKKPASSKKRKSKSKQSEENFTRYIVSSNFFILI